MSAADATASEIREYDPRRDAADLRACFVELQEFERTLDPAMPPGEVVADEYLRRMLERCAAWDGVVFVAGVDGRVVGFACVWTRVPPEADEPPAPYAFVSDLVVRAAFRRRGIGQALLAHAEGHARTRGAGLLKLDVLCDNASARRLYERAGLRPRRIEMAKALR